LRGGHFDTRILDLAAGNHVRTHGVAVPLHFGSETRREPGEWHRGEWKEGFARYTMG
jgi:hypothetical protein